MSRLYGHLWNKLLIILSALILGLSLPACDDDNDNPEIEVKTEPLNSFLNIQLTASWSRWGWFTLDNIGIAWSVGHYDLWIDNIFLAERPSRTEKVAEWRAEGDKWVVTILPEMGLSDSGEKTSIFIDDRIGVIAIFPYLRIEGRYQDRNICLFDGPTTYREPDQPYKYRKNYSIAEYDSLLVSSTTSLQPEL